MQALQYQINPGIDAIFVNVLGNEFEFVSNGTLPFLVLVLLTDHFDIG